MDHEFAQALDAAMGTIEDKPQARSELRCVAPPVGCGSPIVGFDDALSEREYELSGWCQECQDRFFD